MIAKVVKYQIVLFDKINQLMNKVTLTDSEISGSKVGSKWGEHCIETIAVPRSNIAGDILLFYGKKV